MSPETTMLDISLLGPPRVTLDGDALDVDTRKAIALLAYLAVEGVVSRDSLAALLWAEAPGDRARATLRRTLSTLRSAIGAERIDADRNQVELVAGYRSDIDRFEASLVATASHQHSPRVACQRCLPHLEEVSRLHRGDFLEGFSVRDAPEFEDWVRTTGESLRRRTGDALRRLAEVTAAEGDYTRAIIAARGWIELDELHEPAHRLLMLLHAWEGNRPASLRTYLEFVATLDRELGVPPLEATTELYYAILDEDVPPVPTLRAPGAVVSPGEPASPAAQLGRTDEMSRLRDELESSRESGRMLLITGAPWMGKTRLIDEVAFTAADRHLVLTVRSHRAEQHIPHGVAAQVLAAARDTVDDLSTVIPEWAVEELARIDPRLRREAVGESANDPFGELRMLEAFRELLSRLSMQRPVVLSIDDIQWIDATSAGVVAYLAQRVTDMPLLMLMAERSGEPVPEPLPDVLVDAESLTLAPLRPEDLAAVCDDPARAVDVIAQTGGVPLLVLEMLDDGPNAPEPRGVVRYMESRLEGLSDLARQVLASASVLPGICEVPLLRSTSGRSEEEVVSAVEELLGAGLLRELPDTGGLGFTLDALEQLTYDSLTLARRRLLHRRAAESLAQRPRIGGDMRMAAAAATQFRLASDDRASAWYRIAGDLARSAHANGEARAFYENALALGSDERGVLHLGLGELSMMSGDYRAAIRQLNLAAADSAGADGAVVQDRLGEAHRMLGRFEVAGEYYHRAVRNHPRPAEVYADWALLARRMGHGDEAATLAARAVELATESGPPVLASRAHSVAAVIADDPAESLAHLDAALSLAADDDVALMAALNNMGHVLARTGRFHDAIPLVERAVGIAAETGHRHREAVLRNHVADLRHRIGDEGAARTAQLEAMSLFADVSGDDWEPEVWLLREW